MNVARAIELAYAQTLREYAELGAGCAVRAWQSLRNDPTWDVEKDRTFPMVDVRVSAPRFDDNAHTMYCEAAVLCGTKTDDDIDHAAIQSLYGAVQGVCDLLYAQFLAGTDGTELTYFKSVLTTELGASFHFGGFTFADGLAPYDNSGVNMIGISMQVHFSRTDF